MSDDERAIRELFADWIRSTTEGDLELAHRCIADDAQFLVPRAGVMDKASFAQAAAGTSPEDAPAIYELDSRIREVEVFGDHAYVWAESVLVVRPRDGSEASRMAGHSLSVLVRRDGRWQIHRDANTMT